MKANKLVGAALWAATTCITALSVQAAPVNSNAGFTLIEDFESFDGRVTQGPLALGGGASVSSDIDSTLGAIAVDLGENGTWGAGDHFAGIGDLSLTPSSFNFDGSMRFALGAGVNGVGAVFSIFQESGGSADILIEALAVDSSVLEAQSFVINFADPALLNAGQFFGFSRNTADVFGLRVSGDGFVLDDLSVQPIPVPAALPLLLSGMVLLGFKARCARR